MRRMSLRLAIATFTFIIGVAAASVWLIIRHPASAPAGIQPASSSQLEPVSITQGRDLSLYHYGGCNGCGSFLISDIPRCKAARNEARSFIWKHWQERRRGYIIFEFTFDDGSSEAHIFIEPDESGAWHIAWRERAFGFPSYDGAMKSVPDIRSVERRPATKDDTASHYDVGPVGVPILILKDRDGRELGIF